MVSIRVGGIPQASAERAVDTAFRAISEVHALMSFHDASSDVSRLNREAAMHAVQVDSRTSHVIKRAADFSRASNGVFDITIAALLVARGLLPHPGSPDPPDSNASFEDIEFLSDGRIRYKRPLWIDLGGIAKGYAVDHAFERMDLPHMADVCINAGGDLRVDGPTSNAVLLDVEAGSNEAPPVVRLSHGSLATSTARRDVPAEHGGPHFHGTRKEAVGSGRSVTVIADECIDADALTKIVLACPRNSTEILRRYGAAALVHDHRSGWQRIGVGS